MTNPITDPRQAGERLLTFARENRLVQKTWHDNVDGREFACLLGAAAGIDDASQCPASLMPTWLAEALVGLFDTLEKAHAMSFARRWGEAMVRDEWPLIDWDVVLKQWLTFVVQQATHAADSAVKSAAVAHSAAAAAANASPAQADALMDAIAAAMAKAKEAT